MQQGRQGNRRERILPASVAYHGLSRQPNRTAERGWAMTTPTIAFPVRLSEKYRPRKVAEFVGLPKAKRVLSKFVAAPYPCAFLFFGPPGWARLRRRLRWPKRWARSFIIVVPQLFHQQPFAPHRIENLQEQHPQQPLRSNRRTPHIRIPLRKLRRHLFQNAVHHRPDRPQRMIGRHALLRRYITEHRFLLVVFSAHSFAS